MNSVLEDNRSSRFVLLSWLSGGGIVKGPLMLAMGKS